MAYTNDTITYVSHDRQWTKLLDAAVPRNPWLFAHIKVIVPIHRNAAIGSKTLKLNGWPFGVSIVVPGTLSGATCAISAQDEDGNIWYQSDPIARGTRETDDMGLVLMGETTIFAISSVGVGGEAADREIEVSFRAMRI